MNKFPNKAFSLVEISVVILVIGILIAGISSGLELYYDTKIANARSLTKNSPVQRIEGLLTWIETTSQESFISNPNNNNPIGLLKDLSFKFDKINFIQTNSINRPIYAQNGINNLPALYFDGVNDFMLSENSYNLDMFSKNQITIFMVINFQGNMSTAVFFKHESNYRIGLEINNGMVRFDFPYANYLVLGTSNIINKNIIITAFADKINQKIFINSTLERSSPNTTNIPSISSASQFHLGINPGGALATKFYFGELIIYDRALTDKQIDAVSKYLSQKWGIKI